MKILKTLLNVVFVITMVALEWKIIFLSQEYIEAIRGEVVISVLN